MQAGGGDARIGEAALELPFRHDVALFLVFLERLVEPLLVHRVAAFCRHFHGQLERESVSIVQLERRLAADDALFDVIGVLLCHELVFAFDARKRLFKLFHALFEGGLEARDLAADLLEDVPFLFGQERVCLAVHLFDEDFRHVAHLFARDAERLAVADGAAHQPAQNVPRARVGGQDSVDVADEHDRGAGMIGDDAHGLARLSAVVVLFARNLFQIGNGAAEQVGLVAVRQAVEEGEHSVQTESRIHVFIFQRNVPVRRLFVLHIHVVADLDVSTAGAVDVAGLSAALLVREGVEPLVVGAAGGADGTFQLPPVVGLVQIINVFGTDAQRDEQLRRLVVAGNTFIARKHGGADLVRIQAELLGEELERPGRLFLFEVIAQRPVAHHLEKGEVCSVADRFDIDGAHAALHVAQALARGMGLSQKIRHERLHPRDVEHDARGAVSDEGNRADVDVALALIKGEPFAAKLFGCDHNTASERLFFDRKSGVRILKIRFIVPLLSVPARLARTVASPARKAVRAAFPARKAVRAPRRGRALPSCIRIFRP